MANGKWKCSGGGKGFETHAKTTVRNGMACPHCGKPSPELRSARFDEEDDETGGADATAAYSIVVPPLGREGAPDANIADDMRPQEEVPVVSHPTPPELIFPRMWRCIGGEDDQHEPVLVFRADSQACRICGRLIPDKSAAEVTAPYSVVPPSGEASAPPLDPVDSVPSVGHIDGAEVPPHEIVPVEEARGGVEASLVASVETPAVASPDAELAPSPTAEPTPASMSVEQQPRVIVDPVVQAEAFAQAANLAARTARTQAETAQKACDSAEAHTRTAGSSAMKAGNRAAAAEEAVHKCEEHVATSADIVKNVAEMAERANADAKRAEELQCLAHASAEAADASAQKAGVEASRAEDARKAAEKTAAALARRKWNEWAWPVAFVLGCFAVFTLSLSRIPSKSDVKVAVQKELGDRGATPRFAEASVEPHSTAVAAAEPVPAQAPVPQTITPKVQEQEPPLAPIPVPPQATVAPQPQAVASVLPPAPVPSAPALVAPAPAVVLAQPVPASAQPQVQQSTPVPKVVTALPASQVAVQSVPAVVADQAPVSVQQPASECEACVSKMRASPFKFAERDARTGCSFLCGGQ